MDFTLMFGLGGTDDYLPLAKIAEEAGWRCNQYSGQCVLSQS